MGDLFFAPAPAANADPPPGGAELVYLGAPLFVIKGTYFDPIAGAVAALPPHRWVLVRNATIFSEGTTSDADGVSAVFTPKTTGVADDAKWQLVMIPVFESGDSNDYGTHQYVFLDVEKKAWVRAGEIDPGKGGIRRIEARKLLGVPFWSTVRKAKNGGFKSTVPGAASFDDEGTITTSELAETGTRDSPWEVQIDFGWAQTWVSLRFYDVLQKKDRALPQGVLLEAQQTVAGKKPVRVGASSVTTKDGAIYVLHARTPDDTAKDVDYLFRAPKATRLDVEKDTYDQPPKPDLDTLDKQYALPEDWGSIGQEAWEGPADPAAGARQPFAKVRDRGTDASKPLVFHLDDVVLTDGKDHAIKIDPKAQRLAIYTTLAALRDPQQSPNGKDLPRSNLTVQQFPLRAEDAYFERGQDATRTTRFFEHEGNLFDLATARVAGDPTKDALVGARAAVRASPLTDRRLFANQLADQTNGYRLYLFDTRWVKFAHSGKKGKLAHLVCYVPIFVDGAQLHPQNKDAMTILEELMVESSKRWDQNHPGIGGSSGLAKDYVIVPQAGFADDSTILKVRHIFGSRSLQRTAPDDIIIVQIDTQPGRATGGERMRLYCASGPLMERPPDPVAIAPGSPPAPHPYAFEIDPNDPLATDAFDGAQERWFVFAHELGHESGLPDEYLEPIDTSTIAGATGGLPRFDQFGVRSRPFRSDRVAMMQSNQIPRLRHLSHYVDDLHTAGDAFPADGWFKKERPFTLEYAAATRTLVYALPRDPPKFGTQGTYTPKIGTQAMCNLDLYPIGEDEGTIGPCFIAAGFLPPGSTFDGVLVVHPHLWFSMGPGLNNQLVLWNLMRALGKDMFNTATMPHFCIETAGVTHFKRVAIMWQPRFEHASIPSNLGGTTKETTANATLQVRVRSTNKPPALAAGPLLGVDQGDVDTWIWRFIINGGKIPAALDNSPLSDVDHAPFATAMGKMLGRPAGSVKSYP